MQSAFSWALRILLGLSLVPVVLTSTRISAQAAAAAQCIDCHGKITPNIVSDWKLSKHSGVDVTCVTCHGDQHTSASDVAKVKIPTPETCAQCHETQVTQFRKGKHAIAWAAMKAMPTIHWQPMAMIEGEKGCGGCHKIGNKTLTEIVELAATGPAQSSAPRSATPATPATPSRQKRPASPRPARPATWASTIPSGRCIPPPSMACAPT